MIEVGVSVGTSVTVGMDFCGVPQAVLVIASAATRNPKKNLEGFSDIVHSLSKSYGSPFRISLKILFTCAEFVQKLRMVVKDSIRIAQC